MKTETIEILDHGYVKLIESWGSDESVIEAARMSTNKGFEGWEKDAKLLSYLYKHKHMTPFEMGGLIIEVKAPIFVFREWHRHRTQSYNEMSARYVPLPNENYHPEVNDLIARSKVAATTANRQASGTGNEISLQVALNDLIDLNDYYDRGQELYDRFLDHGWPKELARLPVTVGRYSRMRASANLRNWLQFLELRMAKGAQQEIRLFANAVGDLIKQVFPRTYTLFSEGNK